MKEDDLNIIEESAGRPQKTLGWLHCPLSEHKQGEK